MTEYTDPYSPDVVVVEAIHAELDTTGGCKPWTLVDRVSIDDDEAQRALKYLLLSGEVRINAAGEVVRP